MKITLGLILLMATSPVLAAVEWVRDIEVVQIGTYQALTDHFVYFTSSIPVCVEAEPSSQVMRFNEANPGGKSMMASLMAALISKRKVDIQADGCQIKEIYLR